MADPVITKICRKCGVEKPYTLDFFRTMNGGPKLRSTCRVCCGYKEGPDRLRMSPRSDSPEERRERENAKRRKANSPEWAAKNNERRRARYAADAEHRAALLDRVKANRASNPDRHREYDRRNAAKNKAAGSEYNKRRYQALDREKTRAAHKEWRRANPEKDKAMWKRNYEKNKAVHKARAARWAKNNPEAVAARHNRRRAKEAGAPGSYTKDDVRELLRQTGRVCFYCSTALTRFHIDHFIPLSRGGSNFPDNLRLACQSCNCSKGAKMPWEWMPERFAIAA
jgi:5-methylcytosine-specific restriction endonuclease McrA